MIFSSGILVPGGFGSRGTEGKVRAAEWARKTMKPYLGKSFLSLKLLKATCPNAFGWPFKFSIGWNTQ